MTSTVVDPFRVVSPQWSALRVGQVLAVQAALAGILAALGHGPLLLAAACTTAALVVTVAFARVRGRWLFTWLAVAVRYATRKHTLPTHTTSAELLRFLSPDLAETDDGHFVDAEGLVTIFELIDPVTTAPTALPDITALLDRATDPPHVTLQLLVTVARPQHTPVPPGLKARGRADRAHGRPHRAHLSGAGPQGQPGPSPLARLTDKPTWAPPDDHRRPQPTTGVREDRSPNRPSADRRQDHGRSRPPIGLREDHGWGHAATESPTRAVGPQPSAGADGMVAASYRQLTGDRVLAMRRTFVVLRVLRPPGWSDADLRPTMAGAARRLAKRLGPHLRLDHDSALATIGDLAHHDGSFEVEERWSFLAIGGLTQATYRMDLPTRPQARTVQMLLGLPAAATTIAMTAGDPGPSGDAAGLSPSAHISIRIAAQTPDHLAHADHALRQLAAAEHAALRRLDGGHREAVAETLPLGGYDRSLGLRAAARPTRRIRPLQQTKEQPPVEIPPSSRPRPSPRPRRARAEPGPPPGGAVLPPAATVDHRGLMTDQILRPTAPSGTVPSPAGMVLGYDRHGSPAVAPVLTPTGAQSGTFLPPAGMVLGYDRHGSPMVVPVFRPSSTRIVVVGELWSAQVIALRALALGARIDVRTRRWAAWHGFAEEADGSTDAIAVTPDAAPMRHWTTKPHAGTLTPAKGPGTVSLAATNGASDHPRLTLLDPTTSTGRPADGREEPAAVSAETAGSPESEGRARARRHVLEVDAPGQDTTVDPESRATNPPDARWHAVMVVRDQVTNEDATLLADADLVLMQGRPPHEAATAAAALGLPDAADWLSRITGEMLAVATTGTLRWAALTTTPTERTLITRATPNGVDALHPVTRHGNPPQGGD
ncbi:hypothetical protein [Asanoa sp. NPDC050611]|uniref:hypothetical protein n=1 Tax=Asanoa sp. NPDC050611 TaxID=3157098 RepID=UPI0033D75A63